MGDPPQSSAVPNLDAVVNEVVAEAQLRPDDLRPEERAYLKEHALKKPLRVLDIYSEITRKVAKEMKVPLCDLRKEFFDYLKKNNVDNKDSGVLTGDRVHLNAAGNRFVAEVMLKSLGQ